MIEIPQTIIQLNNLLYSVDYPLDEIERLNEAYPICLSLFSCKYRRSGKPFISHLIGTAGVLAALRQPVDVIAAGLLHAAYIQGDFNNLRRRHSPANRRWLAGAANKEIEAYVSDYSDLKLTAQVIRDYTNRRDISEREQTILLMRLANELDDYSDLGRLYSSRNDPKLNDLDGHKALMTGLCRRLSQPELAASFERVIGEYRGHVSPRLFAFSRNFRRSVPSNIYRPRFTAVVRSLARALYKVREAF